MDKEQLERARDAISDAINWLVIDKNTRVTSASQWHEVDEIIKNLVVVRKDIYEILNDY